MLPEKRGGCLHGALVCFLGKTLFGRSSFVRVFVVCGLSIFGVLARRCARFTGAFMISLCIQVWLRPRRMSLGYSLYWLGGKGMRS